MSLAASPVKLPPAKAKPKTPKPKQLDTRVLRHERVCCLAGRETYQPFVGRCRSKLHGHLSGGKAAELVAADLAEQIVVEHESTTTGKGGRVKVSVTRVFEPAVRLKARKNWKITLSDRHGLAPMRTHQLV